MSQHGDCANDDNRGVERTMVKGDPLKVRLKNSTMLSNVSSKLIVHWTTIDGQPFFTITS